MTNKDTQRAAFEAWWESTPILKENKRTIAEKAYQAGRAALQSQDREDALIVAMQEAVDLLGPNAPSCCGCEYEWNHALRVLRAAIDHARRVEGEAK